MEDADTFLARVMSALVMVKEIPVKDDIDEIAAKYFDNMTIEVQLRFEEAALKFKVTNWFGKDAPPNYKNSNYQQLHEDLKSKVLYERESMQLQIIYYLKGLHTQLCQSTTKEEMKMLIEKIRFLEDQCLNGSLLSESVSPSQCISYCQSEWNNYLERYKRCHHCHKSFKSINNKERHMSTYHSPTVFHRESRPYSINFTSDN